MTRARSISRIPAVERYSQAIELLDKPGDTVLVIRGVPRSVIIKCPEGCGDLITLNVDKRSGPAWRLFDRRNRLTIYPSIWRANACEAHFIVWDNKIIWCDTYEFRSCEDPDLVSAVQRVLPGVAEPHRHYEDLAAELGIAVPWDVLWACQALVRKGVAVSSERGTKFGEASKPGRGRGRIDVLV